MTQSAISRATLADLNEVSALYGAVCDHLKTLPVNPCGWTRERYPTRQTAEEWLAQNALYILREGDAIAATCALSCGLDVGYERAAWSVHALADEVIAIHTVATNPAYQGRGYASRLISFAIAEARRRGARTLRLDVCDCNTGAIHVYERMGFTCVSVYDLFGYPPPHHLYRLYEYIL